MRNTMSITTILLEYHKALGGNWNYKVERADALPQSATDVQAVCINKNYIKYYEELHPQDNRSVIYWTVDTIHLPF